MRRWRWRVPGALTSRWIDLAAALKLLLYISLIGCRSGGWSALRRADRRRSGAGSLPLSSISSTVSFRRALLVCSRSRSPRRASSVCRNSWALRQVTASARGAAGYASRSWRVSKMIKLAFDISHLLAGGPCRISASCCSTRIACIRCSYVDAMHALNPGASRRLGAL